MDFGKVLNTAQKNEVVKKEPIRYYSTKFEPPKKEQRQKKKLSVNIQKFLARKEEEEKQKQSEANKIRDDLLALRAKDKRATRRVSVMLKKTKSANQSVIDDARDATNTAVTLAGPYQPDEDDYGYQSQEASAFYNKLMERYSKMPPEEPKFLQTKKKVSMNLSSTKDRVKAALEKEKEEANMPHRRKRKHKEIEGQGTSCENENDSGSEAVEQKQEKVEKKPRPKAPPPMNFAELLRIAEKKQFEPIVIEQKPKEEEKLLTKKQRKELERQNQWQERKLEKNKNPSDGTSILASALTKPDKNEKSIKPADRPNNNIAKSSSSSAPSKPSINNKKVELSSRNIPQTINQPVRKLENQRTENKVPRMDDLKNKTQTKNKDVPLTPLQTNKQKPLDDRDKQRALTKDRDKQRVLPNDRDKPKPSYNDKGAPNTSFNDRDRHRVPAYDRDKQRNLYNDKQRLTVGERDRQNRLLAERNKSIPSSNKKLVGESSTSIQSKQVPSRDIRPKQFPPPDVRRPVKNKPLMANKGRIIDDDDSEYDSEMDDFIDDDEEDNDYSNVISEIFGYNRKKYRDEDDDVDNMETSFAQQMKEEVISSKIGIMEDLEDMKLEEEHKKRKANLKKQNRR